MRTYRLIGLFALFLPQAAVAQAEFGAPDGARVPGAVLECATSNPTVSAPCGIGSAPLKIDQGSAAINPPGGGSGVIGFLAGIYNALSSGLVVGGTVSVANLPAIENVTGSVSVSNLPVTQPVNGTVTANPAAAVVTDCSVSLLMSGSFYQVLASGLQRKSVLLQNVSSGNVGFSLTSPTPAIGVAGTFTLLPNASVQLGAGLITSNAIYATGASASQTLACAVFQ